MFRLSVLFSLDLFPNVIGRKFIFKYILCIDLSSGKNKHPFRFVAIRISFLWIGCISGMLIYSMCSSFLDTCLIGKEGVTIIASAFFLSLSGSSQNFNMDPDPAHINLLRII